MCMITYLPRGIDVPELEIEYGASWNNDGHGWAIAAAPRTMLTFKSMNLDESLTTFLASRQAYPDAPAMFHSRWATHGTVDVSNVHPFPVGKWSAVAHNGVLGKVFQPEGKDTRSDTAIMAAEWLNHQTRGHWSNKERRRIGGMIGLGNKLCILSVSPRLPQPMGYLVNGYMGEWDDTTGAWFSNGDYKYEWIPKTKKTNSIIYIGGGKAIVDDSTSYVPDTHDGFGNVLCNFCRGNNVDVINTICRDCNSCQECGRHVADCLCYYGTGSAFKNEGYTCHD